MATNNSGPDRHDIYLRDVRNGQLVVSYRAIDRSGRTHVSHRDVSTRLPMECLTLFDGGSVDVAELTDEEREWLTEESGHLSNTIDFGGVQ